MTSDTMTSAIARMPEGHLARSSASLIHTGVFGGEMAHKHPGPLPIDQDECSAPSDDCSSPNDCDCDCNPY